MARAELLIRTDVDPAYDADFNAWYDREHMEERAAISGFRWGRRYASLDGGQGRYLALYQTDGLDIFTSDAYRAAFANQTAWSLANFARMRNPARRVCTVENELGAGTGSAVCLIELGANVPVTTVEIMRQLRALPGIVSQRILVPDPALSTPLPAEAKEGRSLGAYLLIEATSAASTRHAGQQALDALALPASAAHCFGLLWELRAEDLGSR